MSKPSLYAILGTSQYDCAECAATYKLEPPFVYIYNDVTLEKYPKLPHDTEVYTTNTFKKTFNSDLYESVLKAMGCSPHKLTLFGFRDMWYPAFNAAWRNISTPVIVELAYGMTVQIQAKSILIDVRGTLHVLEGEIIDAK